MPGNHDHWRDIAQVSAALKAAKVRVLANAAVTVGPLRLGGIDDEFTGQHDLRGTVAAMRRGRGSRVLLTHSPDVAPDTPADITLVLAATRIAARFACRSSAPSPMSPALATATVAGWWSRVRAAS